MVKFRLGSSVQIRSMGIRVKNRDLMIDFYRDLIGFSLIREENALAIMGTTNHSEERFYLEESPRAQAHFDRVKKLNRFMLEVATAEEVEAIEFRLHEAGYKNYQRVVKERSLQLEVIDPEGNCFTVIYKEEQPFVNPQSIDLEKVDGSIRLNESFYISGLQINSLNSREQQAFLSDYLGFMANHPLAITIVETKDEVAAMASHEVAGLEFVRLTISPEDFHELELHLTEENQSFFMDKKKSILTIDDPSGIEWWFDKL